MRVREGEEEMGQKGGKGQKQEMNSTPIRLRQMRPLKENIQTIGKEMAFQSNTHFANPRDNKEGSWENAHPSNKENNVHNGHAVGGSNEGECKSKSAAKICANHLQTEAEFKIIIDGQVFFYCKKCAAHLASNGFEVERLPSRSPYRNRAHSVAFKSPQSKRRQELSSFLASLKSLQKGFGARQEQMMRTVGSCEAEKVTINNVYASMVEYVEYIRDEHQRYFEESSERTAETCRVALAEVDEAIEEITQIKSDIEDNFDKIVCRELDDASYTDCMDFYRQKHALLDQRLEDLQSTVPEITCTTAEAVDDKLRSFKEFFDQLIGIHNSKI